MFVHKTGIYCYKQICHFSYLIFKLRLYYFLKYFTGEHQNGGVVSRKERASQGVAIQTFEYRNVR